MSCPSCNAKSRCAHILRSRPPKEGGFMINNNQITTPWLSRNYNFIWPDNNPEDFPVDYVSPPKATIEKNIKQEIKKLKTCSQNALETCEKLISKKFNIETLRIRITSDFTELQQKCNKYLLFFDSLTSNENMTNFEKIENMMVQYITNLGRLITFVIYNLGNEEQNQFYNLIYHIFSCVTIFIELERNFLHYERVTNDTGTIPPRRWLNKIHTLKLSKTNCETNLVYLQEKILSEMVGVIHHDYIKSFTAVIKSLSTIKKVEPPQEGSVKNIQQKFEGSRTISDTFNNIQKTIIDFETQLLETIFSNKIFKFIIRPFFPCLPNFVTEQHKIIVQAYKDLSMTG